ncbi:hypothetical protein DOY81_000609 [Sarcophaga bullata]|nr:hypothetical protein DOY81_000609 [Sarcophaga bullata]
MLMNLFDMFSANTVSVLRPKSKQQVYEKRKIVVDCLWLRYTNIDCVKDDDDDDGDNVIDDNNDNDNAGANADGDENDDVDDVCYIFISGSN